MSKPFKSYSSTFFRRNEGDFLNRDNRVEVLSATARNGMHEENGKITWAESRQGGCHRSDVSLDLVQKLVDKRLACIENPNEESAFEWIFANNAIIPGKKLKKDAFFALIDRLLTLRRLSANVDVDGVLYRRETRPIRYIPTTLKSEYHQSLPHVRFNITDSELRYGAYAGSHEKITRILTNLRFGERVFTHVDDDPVILAYLDEFFRQNPQFFSGQIFLYIVDKTDGTMIPFVHEEHFDSLYQRETAENQSTRQALKMQSIASEQGLQDLLFEDCAPSANPPEGNQEATIEDLKQQDMRIAITTIYMVTLNGEHAISQSQKADTDESKCHNFIRGTLSVPPTVKDHYLLNTVLTLLCKSIYDGVPIANETDDRTDYIARECATKFMAELRQEIVGLRDRVAGGGSKRDLRGQKAVLSVLVATKIAQSQSEYASVQQSDVIRVLLDNFPQPKLAGAQAVVQDGDAHSARPDSALLAGQRTGDIAINIPSDLSVFDQPLTKVGIEEYLRRWNLSLQALIKPLSGSKPKDFSTGKYNLALYVVAMLNEEIAYPLPISTRLDQLAPALGHELICYQDHHLIVVQPFDAELADTASLAVTLAKPFNAKAITVVLPQEGMSDGVFPIPDLDIELQIVPFMTTQYVWQPQDDLSELSVPFITAACPIVERAGKAATGDLIGFPGHQTITRRGFTASAVLPQKIATGKDFAEVGTLPPSRMFAVAAAGQLADFMVNRHNRASMFRKFFTRRAKLLGIWNAENPEDSLIAAQRYWIAAQTALSQTGAGLLILRTPEGLEPQKMLQMLHVVINDANKTDENMVFMDAMNPGAMKNIARKLQPDEEKRYQWDASYLGSLCGATEPLQFLRLLNRRFITNVEPYVMANANRTIDGFAIKTTFRLMMQALVSCINGTQNAQDMVVFYKPILELLALGMLPIVNTPDDFLQLAENKGVSKVLSMFKALVLDKRVTTDALWKFRSHMKVFQERLSRDGYASSLLDAYVTQLVFGLESVATTAYIEGKPIIFQDSRRGFEHLNSLVAGMHSYKEMVRLPSAQDFPIKSLATVEAIIDMFKQVLANRAKPFVMQQMKAVAVETKHEEFKDGDYRSFCEVFFGGDVTEGGQYETVFKQVCANDATCGLLIQLIQFHAKQSKKTGDETEGSHNDDQLAVAYAAWIKTATSLYDTEWLLHLLVVVVTATHMHELEINPHRCHPIMRAVILQLVTREQVLIFVTRLRAYTKQVLTWNGGIAQQSPLIWGYLTENLLASLDEGCALRYFVERGDWLLRYSWDRGLVKHIVQQKRHEGQASSQWVSLLRTGYLPPVTGTAVEMLRARLQALGLTFPPGLGDHQENAFLDSGDIYIPSGELEQDSFVPESIVPTVKFPSISVASQLFTWGTMLQLLLLAGMHTDDSNRGTFWRRYREILATAIFVGGGLLLKVGDIGVLVKLNEVNITGFVVFNASGFDTSSPGTNNLVVGAAFVYTLMMLTERYLVATGRRPDVVSPAKWDATFAALDIVLALIAFGVSTQGKGVSVIANFLGGYAITKLGAMLVVNSRSLAERLVLPLLWLILAPVFACISRCKAPSTRMRQAMASFLRVVAKIFIPVGVFGGAYYGIQSAMNIVYNLLYFAGFDINTFNNTNQALVTLRKEYETAGDAFSLLAIVAGMIFGFVLAVKDIISRDNINGCSKALFSLIGLLLFVDLLAKGAYFSSLVNAAFDVSPSAADTTMMPVTTLPATTANSEPDDSMTFMAFVALYASTVGGPVSWALLVLAFILLSVAKGCQLKGTRIEGSTRPPIDSFVCSRSDNAVTLDAAHRRATVAGQEMSEMPSGEIEDTLPNIGYVSLPKLGSQEES